jgi:hypothetical protein
MKIVIVDTYYAAFLKSFYEDRTRQRNIEFKAQREDLLEQCFGTADFYSRHLKEIGSDAQELVVNCLPLQKAWARENSIYFSEFAERVPSRLRTMPIIGQIIDAVPTLIDVAIAQITKISPDILYCQDLSAFTPRTLAKIRKHVGTIVGQIACPLPPVSYLKCYDLILTSFPHFVPRLREMGIKSEYFRIGFDPIILEKLGEISKDIDVSFVGGISRNHMNAIPLLEYLAKNTPIRFYGYGAETLEATSPIKKRHYGEVWGVNMYRALARSKMTLNRHIDVAENYANNMRLYEATGVGSLLITDNKDNLSDLFKIGEEVVAYSSAAEARELIEHYIEHPELAQAIAAAGQRRTLTEHTYERRMNELMPILSKLAQRR